MTTTTLAWIALGLTAAALLPGSSFRNKPEIDWHGAHVYLNIGRTLVVLWLLVSIVVGG